MINHSYTTYTVEDLKLGFRCKNVHFSWKPYKDRFESHRKDYDRLIVSIFHYGILKPVITYQGHVLIGMRRVEILQRMSPLQSIKCCEILEDVTQWTTKDIDRLDELKKQIGEVEY